MKLYSLLLSVAILSVCSATEEGQGANAASQVINSMAAVPAIKPAEAPNVQVSSSSKTATAAETAKPAKLEDFQKAVASSGLIDKSDKTHYLEEDNVAGKIQPRQFQHDTQYICNYASIVIYSDVPCKQLSHLRAGEVDEIVDVGGTESPVLEQEIKPVEEDKTSTTTSKPSSPTTNAQKRPSHQNAQKRPIKQNTQKRPNKNPQKRPNKNPQKIPNKNGRPNRPKHPNKRPQNRPNQNTQKRPHHRPNKNGQNRPSKNNKHKRPNQNGFKRPSKPGSKRPAKNGSKRPAKNGQKRPVNNNNKKRPPARSEEYTGVDEISASNQPKVTQPQLYISYSDDSESLL